MILVAVAHVLRIESYLKGGILNLYYSYFSDFAIPFAYYFLLCISEPKIPFLKSWEIKTVIVFLLPSFAETCQYLGIPVLGSTFDPLDYLIYAIGAMTAALLDTQVFPRLFASWAVEKANR